MNEEFELKLPGIERPAVAPEYGAKTAQAVLDIIRLHPEHHDQRDWCIGINGDAPHCGTTLCIGGWAEWIHLGDVSEDFTQDNAQRFLGLSYADADQLFYTMDEPRALAALEYVARGEPIDWKEVWGR